MLPISLASIAEVRKTGSETNITGEDKESATSAKRGNKDRRRCTTQISIKGESEYDETRSVASVHSHAYAEGPHGEVQEEWPSRKKCGRTAIEKCPKQTKLSVRLDRLEVEQVVVVNLPRRTTSSLLYQSEHLDVPRGPRRAYDNGDESVKQNRGR